MNINTFESAQEIQERLGTAEKAIKTLRDAAKYANVTVMAIHLYIGGDKHSIIPDEQIVRETIDGLLTRYIKEKEQLEDEFESL